MTEERHIPEHVGLIMDGNGRWAEAKGLPRTAGHTRGVANMMALAAHAFDAGVSTFTCYSLSTENLRREAGEVAHILSLVLSAFDEFLALCHAKRIAVTYVGQLSLLPSEIREALAKTEAATSAYADAGRRMFIAIAYGGRAELVDACNRAVASGTPVTEESLLSMLSLPHSLDLVIRTGGERRLSNFFLYQASYAELYFSDLLFPDFDEAALDEALASYGRRARRFGR